MECTNSYRSIYLCLVEDLYRDIAECYGICQTTERRDLEEIRSRCDHEGISFLTKTLPRIGKAVDTALSRGVRFSIEGFKTAPDSAIPEFLGFLLNRIFGPTGEELKDSSPVAVKHLRQFVYFLYKLELPYAQETEQSVINAFVQTEKDLASLNGCETSLGLEPWIDGARKIITRVVSKLDPARIKPRHGPGAVATGERVLEKTIFSRIYSKLESVYPFMEYMKLNLNHVAQSWAADQERLKECEIATAKVVLVPKDSRGPRLISCEPLEIQWIQQGLGRVLQDTIESHPWAKGQVNFIDQSVNQRLALAGSMGRGWVTLDMKEASDRVGLDLVKALFRDAPNLLQAMLACRSDATLLPNGTVLTLRKFAPMGSCLCFPVESLVFWALAVSAIKYTYPEMSWAQARKSVYVYGDDLVVREKVYAPVLSLLPSVGLVFNEQKCCVAGSFRESCGCDAYKGVNVTPVRLRTTWSARKSDPSAAASYVALSNAMYGLGHYRTAQNAKTLVIGLYGLIPYTNSYSISPNGSYCSTASGLAFVCHEPANSMNKEGQFVGINLGTDWMVRTPKTRFNTRFQRYEVYSWAVIPRRVSQKKEIAEADGGYAELLRRFFSGGGSSDLTPLNTREPLESFARTQSRDFSAMVSVGGSYVMARHNRLKRAWITV